MATSAKKRMTEQEAIAELERDQSDAIDRAVRVKGSMYPSPPPTSIRLSEPLLKALDRVAAGQHRRRSNLIQHILWTYLFDNGLYPERKRD